MATDARYNAKAYKYLLVFISLVVLNRGKTLELQKDFNDHQFNKSAPQFLQSNAVVRFHQNQWVGTFECRFHGWPPSEISWHYQDLRIDGSIQLQVNGSLSTSTLTVEDFREENADQYTCLAVNAMGFDDGVVWPDSPPILLVGNANIVAVGDIITAKCTSYSKSDLIWKLPGKQEDHLNIQYQLESNEVNNTNILNFTAAETDCGATYSCCTVLKNPQKAISPACADFSLTVISTPVLVDYKSCSSVNDTYSKCQLTCSFRGYPVPQNLSWQHCSENEDNCTTIEPIPQSIIQGTRVTTHLVVIKPGCYKCYANLGESNESSHTFKISGLQVTPKLVFSNVTTDLVKDGTKVVNFTCTFHSNPQPNIWWYREDIGWSNGTESVPSDSGKFKIQVGQISANAYQTTLIIDPYTERDWYFYYCEAYNENGVSRSPPLLAFIISDSLELKTSRLDNKYKDGETVSATCRSGGFPPPQFIFRVIAEYDIAVERSYQDNSVNVTFLASWTNSRVKLECTAVNILQPLNPPISSTGILVAYNSTIVDVHNCSKEDFEANETCELQCTAQHSPLADEKRHEWIYYTYDINDTYYFIMDNTYVTEHTPDRTTYSLRLYNYSAAYYKWYLQYYDPPDEFEELEQVFKIDPTQSGAPLGGACKTPSDCLALHSLCVDNTCQCINPYKFPIEMSPNASACVPVAEPGDNCYNNFQCEANFNCSDSHICECDAYYVYVNEINATNCIHSRYYGQFCIYNIQCTLSDDQSWCSTKHICECLPGYQFTRFDLRCEKVQSGLSAEVITGIVVAVFAVLLLAYYLIQCYRARMRQKRYEEETRRLYHDSEPNNYLTFSAEEPAFSSSTLQFQDQNGPENICLPRVGSFRETGTSSTPESTKL